MKKREKAIIKRLSEINQLTKESSDPRTDDALGCERKALLIELESIHDKEKKKRITEEIKRLTEIFKDTDANTGSYLESLIKRAAFMRITLEDYEEDIRINGSTEWFTQSPLTPPYERERPVIRLYNSMNKNYQSIMKQLADALPDSLRSGSEDEINDFIQGRG
ncbi:hypothetical protein SDC9_115580 [bioreactor metagenome]|uniref:Uncharacterized protein n=1 Tax=bioreactor metagenome TaxID=1076179 RepID=A0A645BTE6_9ZZZZ